MATRPHAISTTDEYLALLLDRIEEQCETLRQVGGVLAEIKVVLQVGGTSEQQGEPVKVDIREPADDAGDPGTPEPVTLAEPVPASPARKRAPAKKATPSKAQPGRG